ncbi:MAG: hypothetical protein WBQ82_05490 [Methyloceanibacter sp.]
MASYSNDLKKALQENLKLRRELATEVAEAKGDKLAAVRFRLARISGALQYALFGRIRPASEAPAVGQRDPAKQPITLEGARKQRTRQLRQLDSQLRQLDSQRRQLDGETNPGECRQRALECVRLAQTTNDQEAKKIWSDLAKTWLIFAADIEANECLLDEWGKPKARGQKTS